MLPQLPGAHPGTFLLVHHSLCIHFDFSIPSTLEALCAVLLGEGLPSYATARPDLGCLAQEVFAWKFCLFVCLGFSYGEVTVEVGERGGIDTV